GLESVYVHLNNDSPGTDDGAGGPEWAYAPGIREGVRVERGQWIGYVGDSGNAESTGSHLHFELHDPELDDPCLDGYRNPTWMNPYPSLVGAWDRGDVPEPPAGDVTRLAGSNRVLTSVVIARRFDPGVRAVIVVPEGSHAEALVAAPLAGLLDAPILLAGTAGPSEEALAEIRRLGAGNAYVLGREDQLAPATEALLREAGVANVARIAEPDPFALSARVAEEVRSYSEAPKLERVFLAVGDHPEPSRAWPDALSAGALAALTKAPVLLTRSGELPEAVRDALRDLAPPLVQVIGGPGAVADGVEAAAREAAGGQSARLAGSNRFATSVAVADEAVRLGLSAPRAWLATGHAFPDALAAGPAAAREGAALILVDGREPGGAPEPEEWLRGRGVSDAIAVGGHAAITEEVRLHLARVLTERH
ncbi:MAG TPA: cell wall-binding repeat-containing protein, partial [Egibacteraceae bacterium]|nr:cell wall-binding repeat-containing protein [Egibacteraceae bacterium]